MTEEQILDVINFVEKALVEFYNPPCAITSMMLTSVVEHMPEDELVSEAIRLSKALSVMNRIE